MVKYPIFAQSWIHRVMLSLLFVSPLCNLQDFMAKVHFFFSNANVAAPFKTREQFSMVKTGVAAPSKCMWVHWFVSHVYCVTYFSGFDALSACLSFWLPYRRSFKRIAFAFPIVILIRHQQKVRFANETWFYFKHCHFTKFVQVIEHNNNLRILHS